MSLRNLHKTVNVWLSLVHTCNKTDAIGLAVIRSRRSHHSCLYAIHTYQAVPSDDIPRRSCDHPPLRMLGYVRGGPTHDRPRSISVRSTCTQHDGLMFRRKFLMLPRCLRRFSCSQDPRWQFRVSRLTSKDSWRDQLDRSRRTRPDDLFHVCPVHPRTCRVCCLPSASQMRGITAACRSIAVQKNVASAVKPYWTTLMIRPPQLVMSWRFISSQEEILSGETLFTGWILWCSCIVFEKSNKKRANTSVTLSKVDLSSIVRDM